MLKSWNKHHPVWSQAPGSKTSFWTIIQTIITAYPFMLALYTFLYIALSVIKFANAYIMKMALDLLERQKEDISFLEKLESSGKLILVLIFSQVGLALLQAQYDFIDALLCERIKHGINRLIFDKVMKKSIQRDPTFTTGEINNLTQVDTDRLAGMGRRLTKLVLYPIEIIVSMIWIYIMTGKAALAGVLVIVVCFYFNIKIMKNYKLCKSKFLDAKDKRGKLVNEVFSNIRFIKMAGMENLYFRKIMDLKKKELYWIWRDYLNGTFFIALLNWTALLFLAAIFGAYIWLEGNLTVSMVFTVMQIFNIFKRNFRNLPYVFARMLDLVVSCQRVAFFLLSENIDTSYIESVIAIGGNNEAKREEEEEVAERAQRVRVCTLLRSGMAIFTGRIRS